MKAHLKMASGAVILALLPALAFAAEHGGGEHAAPEGIPFSVWFHTVNLAIMIGILYYFGRTPLRNYLIQRHDGVKSALQRAERAQAEAEARAAEYEARLAELEREAVGHRAKVEAEAKLEVQRMLEGAERHAQQIKDQTERVLEEELRSVQEQLRSESIRMALEMARRMVTTEITEADQQRLLQEYVSGVNPSEVN